MREIGSIPKSTDPGPLGDYLLSLGVTSRAVESPDGWAIWVHNEDHVTKAREALRQFLDDPHDPRFAEARALAADVRRIEAEKDRAFRKNDRPVVTAGAGWNLRRRPLTALSMAVCVAIYLAGEISPDGALKLRLWDALGFFPLDVLRNPADFGGGLAAIRAGEVWRLFTPVLLHVNLIHLIFNMWATAVESTAIEYTRGTRTLLGLIVVSALVSNVGQYLYAMNVTGALRPWGGYSGVLFALFGYIWMKSRFEPHHGMMIPPGAVRTMLLWLLLGFTNILPMANGAHLAGLLVGVLFGLARL